MTTTEEITLAVPGDAAHTLTGPVARGVVTTLPYASTFYRMGEMRFLCERCGKDWATFQSLWSHAMWHDHPKRMGVGRGKAKPQPLEEHFEAIRSLVQHAPDASLWKARALKAERQLATLRKLLGGDS